MKSYKVGYFSTKNCRNKIMIFEVGHSVTSSNVSKILKAERAILNYNFVSNSFVIKESDEMSSKIYFK